MKLMRHLRAWIAMVLPCLLAVAHGAEPAGKGSARPQPERWLLILDTSSAMERRAQAVEGLVGELLASGMNGQMAPGADIGIWTYNKELFAGVAPMQTWNPAQSNIIAGRSLAFLSKQKYRSKSRTEPVLSELARVVSDSRQLTVVWFSDSAQKIAGTPFDDLINAAYAKYRPALAKTRMPLVTVLRVHQGKYFAQNISVSPWPIEFPPFPVTENTNEVAKLPPAATPPVKSIFIGREPEKTNVLKSAGVELHAAEVKLRPLPDGVSAELAPATKSVDPGTPLPIVAVPPPDVAAPVAPAPKPAETSIPTPAAVALPDTSAPVRPLANISSPQPAAPVPVVAADANTSTSWTHRWPLILGVGCLGAAFVFALLLARRSKRPQRISLITRSFDQNQK